MGILERLLGKGEPLPRLADKFGASTASRLKALVVEAGESPPPGLELCNLETAEEFLSSSPAEQVEAVHACFDFLLNFVEHRGKGSEPQRAWQERKAVEALAVRLLKKKLPFSDDDYVPLLVACKVHFHWLPSKSVVRALELRPADRPLTDALKESIRKLREELLDGITSADTRKIAERLERLEKPKDSGSPPFAIEPVDAWTLALCTTLRSKPEPERGAWETLVAHCALAKGAKPTAKWTRQAKAILPSVSEESFRTTVEAVFSTLGTPAPFPVHVPDPWHGGSADGDPRLVSDRFSDCLRGLIWCTRHVDDPALIPLLGDTAERCLKKLPGYGPLSPKAGNACLNVLAELATHDAIAQLTRLKPRVQHASSRQRVSRALADAAERAGLTSDDLEDLAVATCGLSEVGVLRRQLGDFEAELAVLGVHSTALRWIKAGGKVQKSIPAAVKSSHGDALKALKKTATEIKKSLPAHRDRIERHLLNPRVLPFETWRERYLDHPLVGFLARRLIWRVGDEVDSALVAWDGDRLVGMGGRPVNPDPSTPVRLWHPIESPPETVRAWRDWLLSRGVTQPFKQAHREIYIVTDAERATGTYSNRFAAHILKQHQFNALAAQRGWRYVLQGTWDSCNHPFIDLDDLGWRAEFWVEPAESAQSDVTEMGVYLYVTTDQVRFYKLQEDGPRRIDDVPRRIFSEMLRDVDLFVGVASVANDPAWRDGGTQGFYSDYWQNHAFGELNETARTRRETLESILGKLKIADRCKLEGRYLTVRGDLRTYHIHLGSGNIQMSPNNQYLCIVPGRGSGSAPANVLLPFEGDRMLSIILSKALMLAGDRTIKDPTILSQIRKG